LPELAFEGGTVLLGPRADGGCEVRGASLARAGRFLAAAEVPAFATFFPDVA